MRNALSPLTAGNLPYSAVAVLCTAFFFLGTSFKTEAPKIALAERQALILETVLTHPQLTPDQREELITKPIKRVLEKYQAQGFMVIDAVRSEDGGYALTAIPSDAVNITQELRSAVAIPEGGLK